MAKKRKSDIETGQTSFNFGDVAQGQAPSPEVAEVTETGVQVVQENVIDVDTSSAQSVQDFLKVVAKGRFGDLMVSFDEAEPIFVGNCLVNLNRPSDVRSFIEGVDSGEAEYMGETIEFATPLIFITHKAAPKTFGQQDDVAHFKVFTAAADNKEPIAIGASLLNCPGNSVAHQVDLSSVVLVRELQLTKEAPQVEQHPTYFYLGMTALHAQRETVLAQTRDTPRASMPQPLELPDMQQVASLGRT